MATIGTDINKVKEILERGNLVAIPTETVYGLAGNALNTEAVLKIFKVKKRPHFDPLIVHVANLEQAQNLVEDIPAKALELTKKFWPGPLTLLLKRKTVIPDLVTSGLETVGIRCPNHPLTISLLKSLDFPLAAPSANPFGYISPTKAVHVNEQLGDQIEYILDGGDCNIGIESTILGFENGEPVVYRLGGLKLDALESVLGKIRIQLNISSNPLAPGQLKSHYAPRKKLVIGNITELKKQFPANKIGVLSFKDLHADIPTENQLVLSRVGSMEEAAKNLFAYLRELDKMNIDLIIAERVPETGLGKAINDRLTRAAS